MGKFLSSDECCSCKKAYYTLGFVVLIIVVYFISLRLISISNPELGGVTQIDIMNRKVFNFDILENCCSWWPISHFILFFILGVFFPQCWLQILSLGVLWELIEVGLSKVAKTERQQVTTKTGDVEYSTNWWAGSTKDIVMNFAGFGCGWLVSKLRTKKCKCTRTIN